MLSLKPISLVIIILIIALYVSYHIYYYCVNNFNNQNVKSFFIEQGVKDNYQILNEKEDIDTSDYIGILSIPKLRFQKGFYDINDERNNVNYNIEVLKNSEMPNVSGGSLIIAGHNGNSYLGYFNNIDQLDINDEVDIYYQGLKYQYVIFEIYESEKNGQILFNKNVHENYLVLTTCSKKENKQLIVLAKMFSIS